MATTTLAPSQTASANLYQLTDSKGQIKVSYYPTAPGPIIVGQDGGSLLEYSGVEGNLTFRGSQITRVETAMGEMVSVVLKPQFDIGSVSFTLLLPPVLMGGNRMQSFTTFAVKTHSLGNIIKPGAQHTYEIEHLKGVAEIVMLPM